MRRIAAARLADGCVRELRTRPPEILFLGAERQPGGEVLFRLPTPHVGPDFRDEAERRVRCDTIDLRKVHAGEMVQWRPDVKPLVVAPRRADHAGGRQRRGGDGHGRCRGLQMGLDRAITGGDLRVAGVEEFEILLQDKEMLGAIVPSQCGDDFGFRRFAAAMAVTGRGGPGRGGPRRYLAGFGAPCRR